MSQIPDNLVARLAPATFVLLWSTGFIGAKYGLPYAEPLTFLTLRMLFVVARVSGDRRDRAAAMADAGRNGRIARSPARWCM